MERDESAFADVAPPSKREGSWVRILLSGIVAGVVWTLASMLSIVLLADPLMEAVRTRAVAPASGPFFLAANFGAAVWAMWLFSVVRPGSGSPRRAVLVTAAAWWFLQNLQSSKWLVLFLPRPAVGLPLLIATFPAMLASVAVGALLQREGGGRSS